MTSFVTLRVATQQDAVRLSALSTEVWLDTYVTDGLRPSLTQEVNRLFSLQAKSETLGKADTVILVAEHDDLIIGYAQLKYDASHALVPSSAAVELEHLYVQKTFTQQGIGKTLLLQAEAIALLHGANTLWLTAWVGNTRALEFYTCRGYDDLGATLYCFDNEEHENRVFAKRVS
jgi:GNAT superfamily N-acetyltransferase